MKILELLSISGLCHIVGVTQSTAEHWIEDFNAYIPEMKQKDVTYYYPEAIGVLQFIKESKNQRFQKPEIMEMLTHGNCPITAEKTIGNVQPKTNRKNDKENILTVMQTIGKTVEKVSNQNNLIKDLQEQQNQQNKRIKNMEKQTEKINHLKQEFEALKQGRTLANEYEMKKESFAKLFGN